MKFFIDTADESYIKQLWNKFLSKELSGKEILGVTTNPNAIEKCNISSIEEFESKVKSLCEVISSIRKDDLGIVYVQHPDSNVSEENLDKWINRVLKLSDGKTKIGLKIPPYKNILDLIEKYRNIIDFNVTGVADCSTALMSFSYSPRYVSLIPGRMEEQGVDANAHMQFISQRKNTSQSELITGSMRTIDGLVSAIVYKTVPTIGTRVFDLITEKQVKDFIDLWNCKKDQINIKFSPHINQINTDLSLSFFDQMDEKGLNLKKSLDNER